MLDCNCVNFQNPISFFFSNKSNYKHLFVISQYLISSPTLVSFLKNYPRWYLVLHKAVSRWVCHGLQHHTCPCQLLFPDWTNPAIVSGHACDWRRFYWLPEILTILRGLEVHFIGCLHCITLLSDNLQDTGKHILPMGRNRWQVLWNGEYLLTFWKTVLYIMY